MKAIDEQARSLRALMETTWRRAELAEGGHLARWFERGGATLKHAPGDKRAPTIGAGALKMRRKAFGHYAAIPAATAYGKLACPAWVVDRLKDDCPRNWREVVKLYGEQDHLPGQLDMFRAPLEWKVAA